MVFLVSSIDLYIKLPFDPVLLNGMFADTFLLSFFLILERVLRETVTNLLEVDLLLTSKIWVWL